MHHTNYFIAFALFFLVYIIIDALGLDTGLPIHIMLYQGMAAPYYADLPLHHVLTHGQPISKTGHSSASAPLIYVISVDDIGDTCRKVMRSDRALPVVIVEQ